MTNKEKFYVYKEELKKADEWIRKNPEIWLIMPDYIKSMIVRGMHKTEKRMGK